jgi:hypothetical protein
MQPALCLALLLPVGRTGSWLMRTIVSRNLLAPAGCSCNKLFSTGQPGIVVERGVVSLRAWMFQMELVRLSVVG